MRSTPLHTWQGGIMRMDTRRGGVMVRRVQVGRYCEEDQVIFKESMCHAAG